MKKVTAKLDEDVHAKLKEKSLRASLDTASTVTLSQVIREMLEKEESNDKGN